MPDKDAGVKLPVLATAAAGWRFVALNPGAVVRVGWLPALASIVMSETSATASQGFARSLATGFAVFALLTVAMVAWQRIVLFGPRSREGWPAYRLGRAELMAILHFPLVGYLFMPWQVPAIVERLVVAPGVTDFATFLPWAGFAVLVFPGGLILARAALMLPAFAAGGSAREGLIETADRVWQTGGNNSFRIWILLALATSPFIAVFMGLEALGIDGGALPSWVAAALRGGSVTLYLFIASGVYAEIWRALGGMEAQPARKPAARKKKRKRK
jgi:hypothetical protein